MSEDDPTAECCPICKNKECKRHLLARFDSSGDDGAFGIGLEDGALCDVNEIEVVLQCTRLAWVQSVRATGKPKPPQWIMKERGLRDYFDALGGSGGFDLVKEESDKTAADFLDAYTDNALWHAREEFLDDVLFSCGWGGQRTEDVYEALMRSTTYLSWWASKPSEIAKRLRAKLRRILLEAGVKVKSISRANREKEEIKKMVEGFARLAPDLVKKEPAATKIAKRTRAKNAKRIKPPIRMAKTAGAKKSSVKRASKRKSTRQ
jgi:hypothetical protein